MLPALPPIAVGRELAIVAVAALVLGLGAVADPRPLRVVAAAGPIGFGIFRFRRLRAHPRWTTMRVTRAELTWWSFLMSSAHGAELMVAPLLLGLGSVDAAQAHAWHGGGHAAGVMGVADPCARALARPGARRVRLREFAQREIQRLEELRLEAVEDRVDALLRLGRGPELVGELEALVAEHPLRERLRGHWMLALYRAGRQTDALRVCAEGRRLLRLELGLEPGRELQELERAILAHDPSLDAPSRPAGTSTHAEAVGKSQARRRRRIVAAAVGAFLVAIVVAIAAGALLDSSEDGALQPPPAHGVVAVDAGSGEIVARAELGSRPAAVAAAGDAVWVGDVLDGVLTRVDARSGEVVKSIGIGAPAVDVAVGPDAVWVATGSSGTIVRVDPEIGAVVDRIDLAAPGAVVVPETFPQGPRASRQTAR